SREYQDNLRRQSPNAGSAGLAVNSPHFTGRALDLYVGGSPVDTKDLNRAIQVNTPAYRWLVRNAERFGFRPYFCEPWHWEYVERGGKVGGAARVGRPCKKVQGWGASGGPPLQNAHCAYRKYTVRVSD